MAGWKEGHAGNQEVAGLIPGRGALYHFEFFAYSPLITAREIGNDHANETKNDIHPG